MVGDLGNKKFESNMVCFLISSVPNAAKSEFVLPIPKKPGLKRDRKTAVPISPTTGLAVHEVDGQYEAQSFVFKDYEGHARSGWC